MLEFFNIRAASRETVRSKPRCQLVVAGVALIASGCGQEPGPGYEIHDTKYVGVTSSGEEASAEATPSPCALDRYTGLMWEVKSAAPGLHNSRNTYTWFDPAESHSGELDYRGTPNGGQCSNSDCDTWGYVNAVNKEGYCGFHDWRLPLKNELGSISDPRKIEAPPTINIRYFPHTQPDEYWSSNDYSFQWDSAWVWNFRHGHDRVDWKKTPKLVRLVRGEAAQVKQVAE